MARKKKRGKRYVGDQILAAFQAITGCCSIGGLALIGAIGFGVALSPEVLSQIKQQVPKQFDVLVKPEMAASIAAMAAMLAIFHVWLTIATWQSKRWALWANLILNVFGAAVAGLSDTKLSAILPGVIATYCLLRITTALGPKL